MALKPALLVATIAVCCWLFPGCSKHTGESTPDTESMSFSHVDTLGHIILGAPTAHSIILNLLFPIPSSAYVDFDTDSASLSHSTGEIACSKEVPMAVTLNGLEPDTRYYYRLRYQLAGSGTIIRSPVYSFHTCRHSGSTFSFGVQGDSHPERLGNMFNPDLYKINMRNVAANGVDLYFSMGDDFSMERLLTANTVSQATVDEIYSTHRRFFGMAGCNASLFLVNGNHEHAAKYLLDSTDHNAAVYAALAKKKYYPLPYPDGFYGGDAMDVPYIGLLGDYYSFTWGDALFVVIDPYWHSPVEVGGGEGKKTGLGGNMWDVTLGKDQYDWLKSTLENSTARYKFVFEHHILGTGRGGIEMADLCEFGGYNQSGNWGFDKFRPGWGIPIHSLLVQNHVTIFFQGHDHLYCRQELDGVVYQSVPSPADNTYTAFNASAYTSGVVYPNSGFLKVTVSSLGAKVDYINAFLPADENAQNKNGSIRYSYVATQP